MKMISPHVLSPIICGKSSGRSRSRRKRFSLETIADWPESRIKSGGYVVHTLQAALWCLLTTDGYADCVLKAVNLGRDTDTTAAVAGALAGMHYGANTIPKDWLESLAKYEDIKALSTRFAYACIGTD